MSKYYYQKTGKNKPRLLVRYLALIIFLLGILGAGYVFLPLISWQIFFAPIFASQDVTAPIPKATVVNSSIQNLISAGVSSLSRVDYTNAQNWFPNLNLPKDAKTPKIGSYNLSIPALNIKNALVSTTDYNLANHLINYPGTAIPADNGNTVIFGHSTLPQLFNSLDYKTIFATLYKLKTGDEIIITVSSVAYRYKIYNTTIVDPADTAFFSQTYDTAYLTLVTCTPPGTTWKRLILKARLVPLSGT